MRRVLFSIIYYLFTPAGVLIKILPEYYCIKFKMKNLYPKLVLALISILFINNAANAQGCVAVRQMGGLNPMSANGYTLSKGEVQLGSNYRYFHSFRHFVGTDEKEFRQNTQGGFIDGVERGNAVNIYSHAIDFNLSYGLTDRIQLNVTLPYVHNERSQVLATKFGDSIMIDGEKKPKVLEGSRYSVYAKGIGDVRLSMNYWIFSPVKATKGNLMLGVGVKLATGSHNRKDDALSLFTDPVTKVKRVVSTNVVMDQAIQPGDGGIGISLEAQGFREISRNIYGFANGYYLFNPKESNGTFKSASTAGLEGYNVYASPDQYFVRAGAMTSFGKSKNATASLAARLEGIPAYDALGGQVAYRRPGYVVAVEPGLSYRNGKHSFSLFVPVNFIRNRIQSAADIASQDLQNSIITDASKKVHVQGDAAFADYSINLGYTFRLGKLSKAKAHEDHKM
ncbi:MAG: hypothetical protein JWN56_2946 [Sphingobacteriales bacterium]|nr:hypothetical protein [Sphingobacteriales bacterium]